MKPKSYFINLIIKYPQLLLLPNLLTLTQEIMDVTKKNKIRNEDIRTRTEVMYVTLKVVEAKLQWTKSLARMKN